MKHLLRWGTGCSLLLLVLLWRPLQAQPERAAPDILFFCTDWARSLPWDAFCRRVAEAGYDGVETWLPADTASRKEMFAAFRKYGLSYIFLCAGSGADFPAYLASYKRAVSDAAAYRPVRINCHTGKDHFLPEQNEALIAVADSISRATGVPVSHETHRGRFAFAAHITRQYLERLPSLRLTLDISHWCAVHESLLNDQSETVASALERTDHIHARIGHSQGPQVNDPRAPEWEGVVRRHLEWWDTVVEAHRRLGQPLTITTEFGPPDYLPALPYTRQPVADQWQLNVYMLNLLKNRYRN